MKRYVLDACALVAFLTGEKGGEHVRLVYREAATGKAEVYMNAYNLLEVYYGFYRAFGKHLADAMARKLHASKIAIVSELDSAVFAEAGRLKASYKMSLADAVALAQTIVVSGALLTSDHHEFDAVEANEHINFIWIR